jgi:threonine dehydrogenase-like Zn-dependent dehydrogenase
LYFGGERFGSGDDGQGIEYLVIHQPGHLGPGAALRTRVGSYYGSSDVRSDFHRFLRLWKAGQLDLEGMISRRVKLEDVNGAFDSMEAGEVVRTVITF